MFKSLKIPAVVAIVAACSLSVPTTQARGKQDTDAAPTLITVGKPGDPKYANAGDNLRTGVGSIFIEFDSIAEGGFICTASAISPTHILTAAHCVRNTTEEDQADTVRRVRFIAAGLADAPILEAMSFSVHPLYDFLYPLAGAFAGGDIAVIELAQALPAGIETYELYTGTDEFGQTTRHYGHGRSGKGTKGATGGADFFYARTGLNQYEEHLDRLLNTGEPDLFDQLLHDFDSGGRMHNAMEWWFTSLFACSPENGDNPPWAQDGKCTTFKDGSFPDFKGYGKFETGVAPGDSGGPGFIDGKIAGVHSFGFTHFCGGAGGPSNRTDFTCGLDSSFGEMSGDTRVSSFVDWIMGEVANGGGTTPIPEGIIPVEASTEAASLADNARLKFFTQNVFARHMRKQVSSLEEALR